MTRRRQTIVTSSRNRSELAARSKNTARRNYLGALPHDTSSTLMRWLSIALVATLVASEDGARCPAARAWPSQLDDVAFDDTRPRLRPILSISA